MSHVDRSSFVLAALLVALFGLAPAARGDSHSTDASETAATEPVAPEKGTSETGTAEPAASTEARAAPDPVVGGRDISAQRDPKLVWLELVQIRNKMYQVSDGRDLRSILLTPQEQALFVAFSKRMYDLSKELGALTRADLDTAHQVKVYRSMQQFRSALGEIRTIAGGPVHRDLSGTLRRLTIQMKGLWLQFPDPEKLLGPEGLPPVEELKPNYRS